jgi:hypothetical protein
MVVGIAVMLGGVLYVLIAGPTLLELARRLEREAGLAQRLSTAYEVASAGGPRNAVTYALLADVENRSEALDVSSAGRLSRTRPLTVSVSVVTVAAVIALLVPVPNRQPVSVAASVGGATTTTPSEAEGRTITELAHVLDLVAERSRNSYLQAVAESLGDLADRIEAGTVAGDEAQATVTELTQHLQAAAREVGGSFQQTIESILGAASASMIAPTQLGPLDSAEALDGAAPVNSEPLQAASSAITPSLPDIYMAFDKILSEYEYDPSSLGLRPPGSAQAEGASDAGFYGGVMLAETDPNAAPADSPVAGRVAGQGGGDVAGAAQRSSDSAGDAAGAGEAGLGAGSDSFLSVEVETTAVAALPNNERADGSFSEVELLPSVGSNSARLLDSASSVGAFTRSNESTYASHGIGGSHADVVTRYFTPARDSRDDD